MLDRDNPWRVTALLIHGALSAACVIIGLSFITFDPRVVQASPAFRFANDLVPMPWWGYGFLTIGAALVATMTVGRRDLHAMALALFTVWMGIWTGVILAAALSSDLVAWSSPVWPAFVTIVAAAGVHALQVTDKRSSS